MTCPTPTKKSYDQYDAFLALANTHRKPRFDKKLPVRHYRCQCGFWHLTSQMPRENARV